MTKKIYILSAMAAALVLGACAAGGDAGLPSSAELDSITMEMVSNSFHDKGHIKVDDVIGSMEEITLKECAAADVSGERMDGDLAKRIEQENMQTIQWPANGRYLGDWQAGEKLAQSGRGGTWRDDPDKANGGNCYNCHQISKEELSFGTIGTSLYNYGKIRGVTDPADPKSAAIVQYTWGKIYNAKAYTACSNMPRFGAHGILTEDQIRDLMALLLDPASPVNQ